MNWPTSKLDPQIYRNAWDNRFRTHDPRSVITHLTPEEYRSLYLEVFKVTAPPNPKRILDYGCGTGLLIPVIEELWPDAKYDGADVSQDMIQFCCKEFLFPKHDFWIVPERLSLMDGIKWDFIVCHSVFTHITMHDAIDLVHTIYDLLAPNGRASISICVDDSLESLTGGDWGKVTYTHDFFEGLLDAFTILGHFDSELIDQRFYAVRKS